MSDTDIALTAAQYVPRLLLEALQRRVALSGPWIEPVDGSLVFADISGFTRMSERLSEMGKEGAERLTDIINNYFSRMLDIAGSFGGDNIKFGGDALLLFFSGKDHAARAVIAARNMVRSTAEFKATRINKDVYRLNMSAGVNSGTFYSAAVGVPDLRMQHLLLGNEASRVAMAEGLAEAGQVVVTTATMAMLERVAEYEQVGDSYRVRRVVPRAHSKFFAHDVATQPVFSFENTRSFLPPPILGTVAGSLESEKIEGEHRKVAVLFINLLGVNELLESDGPEVLLNELQQYVSSVVRLSTRYKGFLSGSDIDVQGLKLILAFGAPVAHEYDSANALRFAMSLGSEIESLGLRLKSRIGVSTGFVFTGEVGSTRRRDYTVMGDTVNLAARLMSKAAPGQILVSARLGDEVRSTFEVRQLPAVIMKGKKSPVPIGLLQGEKVTETVVREGPFVLFGRDTELMSVINSARFARKGEARFVIISGSPGIGKGVLLRRVEEILADDGWTIYFSQCSQHTSSDPLVPWVRVLNSIFDIVPGDDLESRNRKVSAWIETNAPGLRDVIPLFNGLLSLSIPETDVVRSLSDEQRRSRLFDLVGDLFMSLTSRRPLAVLIENLQWADSSTLDLMGEIGRNLRSCPFLMCVTQRVTEQPKLNFPEERTHRLGLAELDESASRALVLSSLGRDDVPEPLIQSITSRARGNPLYLQQISSSFRESGMLDHLLQVPAFRLAEEMSSMDMPDQLQGLIMSRIDSLSSATRNLLRIAAVVGTSIDIHVLSSLLDHVPGDAWLATQFRELERLDFLEANADGPVVSYHFKHSLVQEVAYESLLFSRRRSLHGKIARYLETSNASTLEPFYEILLHHYSRHGDSRKTATFGVRSGDKARLIFAYPEAVEYYERALQAIARHHDSTAAQRSQIIERIADCQEASGEHQRAARDFSRSLRYWRYALEQGQENSFLEEINDNPQPEIRFSALEHKIGIAYERTCHYELALKHLKLASDRLPPRSWALAAGIAITRSLTYYRKGKLIEAIRWGKVGLALSRRSCHKDNVAYAYNILANSYVDIGQIRRGISYRRLALGIYEETRSLSGQAEALNNMGVAFQSLGDQEKALACFSQSLSLCERIGNFSNVAIAHNNVGEVLLVMGRLDAAIEHLHKVVESYELKGEPVGCAGLAMVNLSRTYQRQEKYALALEYVGRGTQLLDKIGARPYVLEGILQKAELELLVGDYSTAMHLCQNALKDVRQLGMKTGEARGLRIMGRVKKAMGDRTGAEADLISSIEIARNAGSRYEEGLSLLHFAMLRQLTNHPGQQRVTHSHAVRAARIFRKLGADADYQQARQLVDSIQGSVYITS